MNKKYVSVILALIAVISGLSYFYLQLQNNYTTLQHSYSQLTSSHNALNTSFTSLQIDYSQLTSSHDTLNISFSSLQDQHNLLHNQYTLLQTQIDMLQTTYDTVKMEYDTLQEEYEQLQQLNNEVSTEVENLLLFYEGYQGVPTGYFDVNVFPLHDNRVNQLVSFLDSGLLKQRVYEANVFNCSESSAYVEWALDDAGFNAVIVGGPSPWGSSGYHAWVIVYTIENTVVIEAVRVLRGEGSGSIIYQGDANWYNYYYGYDRLYDNIFEVLQDYDIHEWNWWDGCWGISD